MPRWGFPLGMCDVIPTSRTFRHRPWRRRWPNPRSLRRLLPILRPELTILLKSFQIRSIEAKSLQGRRRNNDLAAMVKGKQQRAKTVANPSTTFCEPPTWKRSTLGVPTVPNPRGNLNPTIEQLKGSQTVRAELLRHTGQPNPPWWWIGHFKVTGCGIEFVAGFPSL